MSLVQQMRGGRDNDPAFGSRMRGRGQFAELIAQPLQARLPAARAQQRSHRCALDTSRFRAARRPSGEPWASFELFRLSEAVARDGRRTALARCYTGAVHDVLRLMGHENIVLPAADQAHGADE